MTVVAQDPGVRRGQRILTTRVDVPNEPLAPGPLGARVHVVDFDAESGDLYCPFDYEKALARSEGNDPFEDADNDTILGSPAFHAINVYALVMRTMSRFEFALGRRVGWGFPSRGHQIKIAPHAFAEANAFYSPDAEALLFGYFTAAEGETVFSCLAHDVVVHETSHALIGGLRQRYTDPSSPDQAAFHEGFSDIVALLSVYSLPDVVEVLLGHAEGDAAGDGTTVPLHHLTKPALQKSVLLGLAQEMGTKMSTVRGQALRQSATLPPPGELGPRRPADHYLRKLEYHEPHRRGEILVAAMMNAFLDVWVGRIERLRTVDGDFKDRRHVAEEGAAVADYLLTMVIRALDYTPPVHLEFGDFLSAMLTADYEIRPDDSRYEFREHLRQSFAAYGIRPATRRGATDGQWVHVEVDCPDMDYRHTRFESMQRDADEVFRFLWQNRAELRLHPGAYTRVISVRPVLRVAPDDGFPLRETVIECLQQLTVRAADLGRVGVRKPAGMSNDQRVELQGGLTLIFDEYGRVKYRVSNSLPSKDSPSDGDPTPAERHSERLRYLFDYGYFRKGMSLRRRFSTLHQMRALGVHSYGEQW